MNKVIEKLKEAHDHCWEVYFGYQDEDFHIDYEDKRILLYNNSTGNILGFYQNVDDLLDYCILQGKTLRTLLTRLDYMQI